MFCEKCGAQLPENATFCSNCGAKNEHAETAQEFESAVSGKDEPRGFSNKRNIIIIAIAAAVLLAGGVGAAIGINAYNNSAENIFSMAQRYLNEKNYEQAIMEFKRVLELDPTNIDAYIGLAEAYEAIGDTDNAIDILQKGYDVTGDGKIKAKLDELSKPEQPAQTTAATTMQTSVQTTTQTSADEPQEESVEPIEEMVVFTDDDISFIHRCFESSYPSAEGFRGRLGEFDFTNGIEDPDVLYRKALNWQQYILSDTSPDLIEREEDGLFGDIERKYMTPEAFEKAIQEKLYPEFDISEYELPEGVWYWSSDNQMFIVDDGTGYIEPEYYVLREGQEGNYYSITVLEKYIDYNAETFTDYEPETRFLNFKRQKYLFRKLPNGNIAPIKMTFVEPEEEEIRGIRKAISIYDKCHEIKEKKLSSTEIYGAYLHDMDYDGNLDLVILTSGLGHNLFTYSFFSNMDINNVQSYLGELYGTKSGDWVVSYLKTGYQYQLSTYTFGNGDIFSEGGITSEGIEPAYSINGISVTLEEYNQAFMEKEVDYSPFPFDYDFKTNLYSDDLESILEFAVYCMNNLI